MVSVAYAFHELVFVLLFMQFIEAFSILSCATLMVTQIFPLFFIPLSEINPGALVLKFYISIFCVVFILVEYDAPIGFLKESQILQNYFSRGFVYSFLGVVRGLCASDKRSNNGPPGANIISPFSFCSRPAASLHCKKPTVNEYKTQSVTKWMNSTCPGWVFSCKSQPG